MILSQLGLLLQASEASGSAWHDWHELVVLLLHTSFEYAFNAFVKPLQ